MQKKKIAFVIASKNRATQLLSHFFDDASRAGFDVTVFCPDEVYAPLKDFFEEKKITRFNLPRVPQRSPLAVFNHLRYFILLNLHTEGEFHKKLRQVDFKISGFFLPYVLWPLARGLRLFPWCRRKIFWDKLEQYLFGNTAYYQALFKKHHFDWVVFPGPVLRAMSELLFFIAAKKAGLRSAVVDEAFGQFAVLPVSFRDFDRIFAWNKYTIDQAVRFHHIPKEVFTIAGPLRFDSYFKDAIPSREDFFAAHDLDRDKRIVSLVLSGVDIEYAIIDNLITHLREKKGESYQLVVRTNPFLSKVDEYTVRYAGVSGIVFNDPRADVHYNGFTSPQGQIVDLGALLKYSDVVISHASTVAIEGAVFGTPAIYHLFGLSHIEEKVSKGRLLRHQEAERRKRYDEWPFIVEVLNTGGVPLARSMEELLHMVDEALANRDMLVEERRALVKKICTYTDGLSGERIAQDLYKDVY